MPKTSQESHRSSSPASRTSSLLSEDLSHTSNRRSPQLLRAEEAAPLEDLEKNDQSRRGSQGTASISRVSTIKFDDARIVPKSKRRGLLSRFCIIPEYDDPRDYPVNIKRCIIAIVALVAMVGPMGTGVLFPATNIAVADFHTTTSTFNFSIGVYLITLGVFPLWWSNFSERHGRRSIYVISFFLNVCFSLGSALSKSIGVFIFFRALSGGMSASVQSIGAGTISDIYEVTERGTAMGWFYLGPLIGPLLAPIIGGAISSNDSMGWRGTMWFLVILAAISFIGLVFLLPETLRRQDNKEAIRQMLRDRRSARKVTDNTESSDDSQETVSGERAAGEKAIQATAPTPAAETAAPDSEQPQVATETPADVASLSSGSEDSSLDPSEVQSLRRIMTMLSRAPSIVADEVDQETPMDPQVPLSRVATTVSFKSRKTQQQRFDEQVEQAEKVEHGTWWQKALFYFKIYGWGPLKSFCFLKYPPVFLAILYSAPCFAILYVQNITLSYEYERPPYNFSPVLTGLVYVPNSVAYFIASVLGGKFQDYLLRKKIQKYGVIAPEARFGINVYVAAAIIPAALLITGWCLDKKEHWVTPLIGTALFGFAQMIVIGVTVTYLTDCLPGKGATGVAVNNFIRQMLAAGFTFATVPIIDAIDIGPLMSICAGVSAILAVCLVFIVRRGDYWRETFDLEKLYDFVDN